jgi:hypothetical protein
MVYRRSVNEGIVLLALALFFLVPDSPALSAPAPAPGPDGSVVVPASGTQPQLFFASDSATEKLAALFTPTVIADLKDLHAGVALAIRDFTPQRAQLVRQLMDSGVPVIAWLVLPKEQGYYFNVSNAPQAAARFSEFQAWTAAQSLHWSAVGLDIEPKIDELQGGAWHLATSFLHRYFDNQRVERARQTYAALIGAMQAAGYRVQTYQLLFLIDERKAHTDILQRMVGLVDVRGDEEVLMLYSSFSRQAGPALIWSYGPESQSIAVGSTAPSGSAKFDARYPPLNWEEFSRDLLVASHFSRMVGVYSLEGCVQQGFLSRLKTLRWDQSVTIPAEQVKNVIHFRHFVRTVLWVSTNIFWLLLIPPALIVGFVWRRRALRRQMDAQANAAASGRPIG